jgi:hypothetical protein
MEVLRRTALRRPDDRGQEVGHVSTRSYEQVTASLSFRWASKCSVSSAFLCSCSVSLLPWLGRRLQNGVRSVLRFFSKFRRDLDWAPDGGA